MSAERRSEDERDLPAGTADLVIRNGSVVTSRTTTVADLVINRGTILGVAPVGPSAWRGREEIDARGLVILPGLIDSHVHFRDPGLEAKEDWSTGSAAAIYGGVTTVLDMPNTVPPTTDPASARLKVERAVGRAYCDFGLFAAVTEGNLDGAFDTVASGLAIGIKVFLGPTTGNLPVPDSTTVRTILERAAATGIRIAFHAERQADLDCAYAHIRASGRTDPLAFGESRPIEAETNAIDEVAEIALQTRASIHACHVSSAEAVDVITAWRARGADLTCEVTPHHCLLSTDDLARLGPLARVNPPLRAPGHGAKLLGALADGRIDAIASDHAPHEPDLKLEIDIWSAASGFAGVETLLPLFLTEAVHRKRLSLERLAAATSEAPAKAWGLWPRKGAIRVGSDADLTLVDMAASDHIDASRLHGRNNHSPYIGRPVQARVVAVVLRGNIIMRDGQLIGEPRGALVAATG